jgi:hypothetical protein
MEPCRREDFHRLGRGPVTVRRLRRHAETID